MIIYTNFDQNWMKMQKELSLIEFELMPQYVYTELNPKMRNPNIAWSSNWTHVQ